MALMSNPATAAAADRAPRVFISAAEPSGDLHGASLIEAFRRLRPGAQFAGLAGPRMRAAGCLAIEDLTERSSMLLGVIGSLGSVPGLLARVDRRLAAGRFDAAVLVDSPLLNLTLARRAKARGLPVLYYVAPQVWAWAEYRWRKLRDRVDRMAVVLPFEEAYFADRGIPARYVGHPLFDALSAWTVNQSRVSALRGESGAGPVLGLLPGSRRQVVAEVLPGQLEVAAEVRKRHRRARFLVSVANPRVGSLVRGLVAASGLEAVTLHGENAELINACDLLLVASGTATLEVAFHHKPMIVMYNHSRLGYQLLGRWLIATKYLCLLNILAGREIVPEYMPYYRSVRPIAERAIELLATRQRLERMSRELKELMDPMVRPGASENTARMLLELIGSRPARTCPRGGWRRQIW